jgi:hypothetical protein
MCVLLLYVCVVSVIGKWLSTARVTKQELKWIELFYAIGIGFDMFTASSVCINDFASFRYG